MSLKRLSTQTMVAITGPLIDPQGERPFIEALPQASGLLGSLDKVHAGILETQVAEDPNTGTELTLIKEQSSAQDVIHDRKSRGIHHVMTGFAELADDPDTAASILALRDKAYPNGLRVVQWSYADEAGEVELVETRLTDEDRAQLAKLPYPGGTLADAHNARVEAGRALGKLEKRRVDLVTKAGDKTSVRQQDVVRARNEWIRAMRAFLAVLDLEEMPEADRTRLLGPLREAERKEDSRKPSTTATANATPETPTPGE